MEVVLLAIAAVRLVEGREVVAVASVLVLGAQAELRRRRLAHALHLLPSRYRHRLPHFLRHRARRLNHIAVPKGFFLFVNRLNEVRN